MKMGWTAEFFFFLIQILGCYSMLLKTLQSTYFHFSTSALNQFHDFSTLNLLDFQEHSEYKLNANSFLNHHKQTAQVALLDLYTPHTSEAGSFVCDFISGLCAPSCEMKFTILFHFVLACSHSYTIVECRRGIRFERTTPSIKRATK